MIAATQSIANAESMHCRSLLPHGQKQTTGRNSCPVTAATRSIATAESMHCWSSLTHSQKRTTGQEKLTSDCRHTVHYHRREYALLELTDPQAETDDRERKSCPVTATTQSTATVGSMHCQSPLPQGRKQTKGKEKLSSDCRHTVQSLCREHALSEPTAPWAETDYRKGKAVQ
jgi:hypothetical protein